MWASSTGFCSVKRLIPVVAIILGWASAAWAAQPARVLGLPVTPIEKLSAGIRARDLSQRVRVHGTITYFEPGRAVVLAEDGDLLFHTQRGHSFGGREDLKANGRGHNGPNQWLAHWDGSAGW